MAYFLHVSAIGIGIFNENGKIVELVDISADKLKLFFQEGNLRELDSLKKKYSNLIELDLKRDRDIFLKILNSLNSEKYFNKFYEKNMEMTANMLRNLSMKDYIISQSINNIDETEKVINILTTRLREWYSLYNPELSKKIEDNRRYSLAVIDDKKEKSSIGGKVSVSDLEPVISLAKKINSLFEFIDEQETYLKNIMTSYCPNLSAVATELIGARLIALSGSLKKLSLFPSSTIQTLGAEKAMFRHLKSGDRPPKYGIIILHPIINNQKRSDKGKVARSLASKISIAAKVDYFGGSEIEGYDMISKVETNLMKKKKDTNKKYNPTKKKQK